MSIKGKAYIAGAFEHPTRKAPDKSVAQLHAECAKGALADAGLTPARTSTATSAPATFENALRPVTVNLYAMAAMRHMHEYGTTPEQLAWVKVAASHHAQHNPHAMLRKW
jgi:acetyl-CoA acetyltransferase